MRKSCQQKKEDDSILFVVPAHIVNMPGITLSFLKVYALIFSFFSHNKPCKLSDEDIIELAGVGKSQMYKAFAFFEKNQALQRSKVAGERYFIQPDKTN